MPVFDVRYRTMQYLQTELWISDFKSLVQEQKGNVNNNLHLINTFTGTLSFPG